MKSLAAFISKYRLFYVFLGLGMVVVSWYTIAGVIAGREKIKAMNDKFNAESARFSNGDERVFDLRRENGFVTTRLALAKSDSVSLVIDLVDSVVSLDLKGVAIHKAKIVHLNKSSLFEGMNPGALVALSSKPMKVKSITSTIIKEVRHYKKAPKDTIEAAQLEVKQDTLAAHMPSIYVLDLDNDIHISFLHEIEQGYSYAPFIKEQKLKQFNTAADSLLKAKLPPYVASITIELAKKDATTIFRAIPHHAYVAIRF
jgi:hypothetical protein